jgi:ubiquinone/menaquinone biosynthesis C-methylase UbiE
MNQEKVWDSISKPWKTFRVKPVEEASEFLKNKKGKILDLGCGSGRNFVKTEGVIYAVDFSEKMLGYASEYAREQGIKVITKKALAYELPFEDNFFDAAIFIATLHCIKGKEKREKSLRELWRVLKPGAEAIISVWSRNHERIRNKPKESMIPWTVDGKKYLRYYYIYDNEELKELLEGVAFKIIDVSEDENIIAFVKK